eukprot:2438008-Rhodomonas_salina.2
MSLRCPIASGLLSHALARSSPPIRLLAAHSLSNCSPDSQTPARARRTATPMPKSVSFSELDVAVSHS